MLKMELVPKILASSPYRTQYAVFDPSYGEAFGISADSRQAARDAWVSGSIVSWGYIYTVMTIDPVSTTLTGESLFPNNINFDLVIWETQ
jgi:hypothetical protein